MGMNLNERPFGGRAGGHVHQPLLRWIPIQVHSQVDLYHLHELWDGCRFVKFIELAPSPRFCVPKGHH